MKHIKIECDGYSVGADFYQGKNTDKILLTLIGWTSSKKTYGELLDAIVKNTGMSVLVFDYSGHGDSAVDVMQTTSAQHLAETKSVFDWLKSNYPKSQIAVMGSSYGGHLAAQLTKSREFNQLILRAPAIYKPSELNTLNGVINSDEGWAAKDAYRKDAKQIAKHPLITGASNFKGKTLVVVHENDEVVNKTVTDAYIKAFGADVYVAKSFPHSMRDVPKKAKADYQKAISTWLTK